MSSHQTLLRAFFLLAIVVASAMAWTPTDPRTKTNNNLSRRSVIEGLTAGAIANVILAGPANADVTNKVASSTALRSVKRSEKQLKGLVGPAQSNDFVQVKAFLRMPPFADVRRNCFVVVRGGEDGPNAKELESAYKAFIASIEKIDSTSSLGIRGRKISDLQMADEYQVIEKSLKAFVKVAEEATTEIPVQSAE